MRSNRLFLAFSLFLLSCSLFAQDYPRQDVNLEKLADEIFPMQDLDLNYEELYENLAQLLANPIDLNKATAEDLRMLFILKEVQIEELLRYRKDNGPFLSVYELQTLSSLDIQTLYKLAPFVFVKDSYAQIDESLLRRVFSEDNNYFLFRYERTLEESKSYLANTDSASKYTGSPDKLYARFRVNRTGDFSFGFTMEKDAGEAFTFNRTLHQYGFDYYSFHGQVMNKGRISNLILGDFQAQFGQGLTLGGSFGMGKGSETITTIRRSNLGFIPYTSLTEAGFFRGAAVTYRITPSLYIHSFGSHLYRDGNIAQDTLSSDELTYSSSFTNTGFHRTPSEMARRKQIGETNYGVVLNFKKGSLDAGLVYHQTIFNLPVYRNPSPHNQFSFSGSNNANAGLFINYSIANFTFFSEAAQTLHHGKAVVLGVLGSLTPQFDVSLLYRKYDRDFYSFYSNAIAESTFPQNETGMYWGWKYSFSKRYSLAGYVDLFRFPWLRFRGYAPSNGSEWFVRFNHQPSKKTTIFLQAREENKIRNSGSETTTYQTSIGKKRSYCINFDYPAGRLWSFKTRAQFSTYQLATTTKGFALIHDVNLNLGRLSLSARYALFDTDDYDNRQYIYERDVWLAFSFPAYYGVGVRNYLLLHYKLTKKADIWIRWAHTQYTDRDTIGSGGNMINGNTRNDLKFQARIRI
jgi:Helix-hairpin-helix motif